MHPPSFGRFKWGHPELSGGASSEEKLHRIDLDGGISSLVGTQSNFLIAFLIVPFMADEMGDQ